LRKRLAHVIQFPKGQSWQREFGFSAAVSGILVTASSGYYMFYLCPKNIPTEHTGYFFRSDIMSDFFMNYATSALEEGIIHANFFTAKTSVSVSLL
jgi:hypothetical protein